MLSLTDEKKTDRYDICVVGGAGHVGLPLSIVFAECGQRVLIYDINKVTLELIDNGKLPFIENGAESRLKAVLRDKRLSLSDRPEEIKGISTIVITIGTPIDEFLNPTLKSIALCIERLIPFIDDNALLVMRSTVYPGVVQWIDDLIKTKGRRVKLSFCPERVVQGFALEEIRNLPQIVSGTTSEAEDAAAHLFEKIAPEIVRMKPMEAEFAKLFSNAYRYIQFAVANQFFMMTSSAGVDYYKVLDGLKHNYPRAKDIPGAGLSAGPCLLKDTMQLAAFFGNQFGLGHSAMSVNEGLPLFIIENLLPRDRLKSLTVGLLGMAFKANNDDTRSSLSYKIKKALKFRAKEVLTTDPHVTSDPELCPLETVLKQSDILILCAPHDEYKNLDPSKFKIVDIWNFYPRYGSR